MERTWRIPELPVRPSDGHKGTFGTVLVVGGSRGMAGAAALCGRAVLRSGAGLCRIACPGSIQAQVAVMIPCATTLALGEGAGLDASALEALLRAAGEADCVALGPGLGTGAGQRELVCELVGRLKVPVLIDADGLGCLVGETGKRFPDQEQNRVVLTPHPGETARLLGETSAQVQAAREEAAVRLACWCSGVCLLKGAGTVVTDGRRIYINETGNCGMATGGSGDVLTGVVAALLAQGMPPFAAACLGAWLHGRAGDRAGARLGLWSVTAEDLLAELPGGFLERAGEEAQGN